MAATRRPRGEFRVGRPTTLPGEWGDLVEAYGGIQILAEKVGVHYSTIWKWATGRREASTASQMLIGDLAKRVGIRDPFLPKIPGIARFAKQR